MTHSPKKLMRLILLHFPLLFQGLILAEKRPGQTSLSNFPRDIHPHLVVLRHSLGYAKVHHGCQEIGKTFEALSISGICTG